MIEVLLYHIALYCIFFSHVMANLFFFSIFIIECFLHPPDETHYGRNRSRVIDMV